MFRIELLDQRKIFNGIEYLSGQITIGSDVEMIYSSATSTRNFYYGIWRNAITDCIESGIGIFPTNIINESWAEGDAWIAVRKDSTIKIVNILLSKVSNICSTVAFKLNDEMNHSFTSGKDEEEVSTWWSDKQSFDAYASWLDSSPR